MQYKIDDDADDDDNDEYNEWDQMIKEQSLLHAKLIIESSEEEVNNFITNSTGLVFDTLDQIEDQKILIELTQLIGTLVGGMGKAIVELKKTNIQLKTDFITDQIKNQNPDLN